MILSDRDIRRALESGRIAIDPDTDIDDRIGPDAVDFRLGSSFLVFERNKQPYIDARRPETAASTARTVGRSCLMAISTVFWMHFCVGGPVNPDGASVVDGRHGIPRRDPPGTVRKDRRRRSLGQSCRRFCLS